MTGSRDFPLWNQQARDQGLPRPGFVPPLLYALAEHDPGSFTDVTQGTNALFGGSWSGARGLRHGDGLGLAGRRRRGLLARPLNTHARTVVAARTR